MTTEHRIPSRLFLRAGRDIEEALRRDTSEAVAQFKRDGDLIATWEDDRAVLLHGVRASDTWPNHLLDVARPGASATLRALGRGRTLFLDLVVGVSRQIYLSAEGLHVEFPRVEKEVGDFLSAPENQDVLRDVGRELTGREIDVRLSFVEELQPAEPPFDRGDFIVNHLRAIIDVLRAAGDDLQVAEMEKVMADRIARQQLLRPDLMQRQMLDALLDRTSGSRITREFLRKDLDLTIRKIIREEGGRPSSHKSEE